MIESLKSFILWLGDFVEDGITGKPSVKRYGVAIGSTVMSLLIVYLGFVVGQAVIGSAGDDKVRTAQIAADSLETVVGWFVFLVTGNYAGGKIIERISPKNTKKADDE